MSKPSGISGRIESMRNSRTTSGVSTSTVHRFSTDDQLAAVTRCRYRIHSATRQRRDLAIK